MEKETKKVQKGDKHIISLDIYYSQSGEIQCSVNASLGLSIEDVEEIISEAFKQRKLQKELPNNQIQTV